jgi:hypothetical protein
MSEIHMLIKTFSKITIVPFLATIKHLYGNVQYMK